MNELLQTGQTVKTRRSGQPCRVERFLGGGGQGEVYRAEWAGGAFALKWYFPNTATADQRAALEELVNNDPARWPVPSDRFLWPLDIAEAPSVKGFGYLMKLREPQYKSLLDLMAGRIDPSFRTLTTVGLQLADSFHKLHAAGLCYRDISFGNAFFEPTTGEVLICDNDNVAPNRSAKGGVLGTPDFMAPEIVRGDAAPSRQTDLFSLAVLLFYVFHLSHPLYGKRILGIKCLDLPARTKLCGTAPLFIFDPKDTSNCAVDRSIDPLGEAGANALVYWPIYPGYFRDTFMAAFTKGIHDPDHGRVMEGEWRLVLSRLRDAIFYCSHCGKENFFDDESGPGKSATALQCWSCRKQPKLPYRLALSRSTIMLTHDAKLYPHHVCDQDDFDFSTAIAEIARHPADPNVWGLKNCTAGKWSVTMPDGTLRDVEPGKSVRLAAGIKINFGTSSGEIRY